jgi:hypothetical protein
MSYFPILIEITDILYVEKGTKCVVHKVEDLPQDISFKVLETNYVENVVQRISIDNALNLNKDDLEQLKDKVLTEVSSALENHPDIYFMVFPCYPDLETYPGLPQVRLAYYFKNGFTENALSDSDDRIRALAYRKLGTAYAERALQDTESKIRWDAYLLLDRLDLAVHDQDPSVRLKACQIVGTTKDHLTDSNPRIRRIAYVQHGFSNIENETDKYLLKLHEVYQALQKAKDFLELYQ